MKHIYAVNSAETLDSYQSLSEGFIQQIQSFLDYLRAEFAVVSLPRCVVWTDRETATHLISDVPIPAYTNDYRTVFCPEINVWRDIYLQQLAKADTWEIRQYYNQELTNRHVLQILGHEFVHHSDLFIDDAFSRSQWFEEGMCEYISRRFFLSGKEFERAVYIQQLLVSHWEERNGKTSIESFDASTYLDSYDAIFYHYWRSFLAVKLLIEQHNGDIMAVFRKYQLWYQKGHPIPLLDWFQQHERIKGE